MLGCAGGRTWQMEGGEVTMGWEQGTASYLRQVPAILSLPATGSLIVAGSFLRAIDEICLRFGIVSASKQGIGRSTLMSAVSTCFDSPIVSNRPRIRFLFLRAHTRSNVPRRTLVAAVTAEPTDQPARTGIRVTPKTHSSNEVKKYNFPKR